MKQPPGMRRIRSIALAAVGAPAPAPAVANTSSDRIYIFVVTFLLEHLNFSSNELDLQKAIGKI
jgi:hypothetical protein